MIDITEIIKENNKEIKNFKNNILRLEKLNEDDSSHFSNMLLQNIYKLIDNTFTFLFSNNCRPQEKEIIVIQLEKLHHMFFGELSTMYSDGLWELYQEREQEYYKDKHTFDPINFRSEFILEQIHKFKDKTYEDKSKPTNIVEDDSCFYVGIEFANGNAYDVYKKYLHIKIKNKRKIATQEIFKDNYKAVYDFYVYGTFDNYTNKQKNIFKRTDAENELKKVYAHCTKSKIDICEEFLIDCRKNGIELT